jgi:RNA polymerase sigma-70 factor (ECF subfamily)
MKPALRDTAVLVAGQQLTHAEAAEILGIAEATVSWRMHEVRRILSKDT